MTVFLVLTCFPVVVGDLHRSYRLRNISTNMASRLEILVHYFGSSQQRRGWTDTTCSGGLHLADLQFQLHTAVQKVSVYEYITSIYNLYFYSPGLGGKQK